MKHFQLKPFFLFVCCMLLAGGMLHAQRTITGVVTDAGNGETLLGATVRVVGTNVGAVSDATGTYRVAVPAGATELQFSYSGFVTQTVPVGASNVVNVQMLATVLNEVVVIGYGTVKRDDATGSVQTVATRDFNKGAITGPQELLAGKVAGVQITTNGEPGGGATIRIRGGSSLSASNDPLIVIDGVPVANDDVSGSRNPLNILNPNDIETFTVLKDASATAIYGSRASNGVILITTKKGTNSRKIGIDYNGNIGTSSIARQFDVLTGDQYRDLINTQFAAGHPARSLVGTANTDWQKQIYQSGLTSDHNLAFSGAVAKLPYRVSLGYTTRDGLLKTDNFGRTTLAVNLSPDFFKNTLQLNINFKTMQDKNRFANQGAIGSAAAFDPTQPVYSADPTKYGGYYTWLQANGDPNTLSPKNPLALLNDYNSNSKVNRYILSGSADYRFWFLKDLHANLNMAIDKTSGNGTVQIAKTSSIAYVDGGRNEKYTQDKKNELLEFYLNYTKGLGNVNLDLMGGYSWQHFYRSNYDFATSEDGAKVLTPATTVPKEYYLVSLFGRANFTFFRDYLLTFTLRRDGTSRFSPDNRYSLFPAAAFAWKIVQRSKGDFTGLKLRLGYGVTGQQDISSDYYPYLARYLGSYPNAQYQFGSTFYNTLRPQGYDANIKWEQTTTYNGAVDFGFLSNRVTGTFELYQRKTTNLINYIPVPAGTNLTNYINTNVGDLENKGVELSVNTVPVKLEKLTWNLGFNVSANSNKITRLTATDDPTYLGVATGGISGGVGNTIQVHSVGYPASSFFVYQQVFDSKGLPIEGLYVDRNGDGKITPDDRYRFKKPAPDFFVGITSGLNYGNLDFSFACRANIGNYIYDNTLSANTDYNRLYSPTNYLNNIDARYKSVNFQVPQYFSNYFVKNASFLRMDHITLGYNFTGMVKKVRNLRAYVTLQNLFVITQYKGIDPEVASGIDNNIYPRSRTFLFGVNVGL
jgi:iron complex outermembrane receptor protein